MTVEYKDHFEMLSSEAQALISQIQLSGGFDIYVVNEIHRSTTFLCGTTFFLAPYDHAIEYSSWNVQASLGMSRRQSLCIRLWIMPTSIRKFRFMAVEKKRIQYQMSI